MEWNQFKAHMNRCVLTGLKVLASQDHENASAIVSTHEDTSSTRIVDMALQDAILGSIDPSAVLIFSEDFEGPEFRRQKFFAVIDPLDGTTNFARGLPIYCISIAAGEITDERPTFGQIKLAIIADNYGNNFYCDEERKPKRNNCRIFGSDIHDLSESRVRISSEYKSTAPLVDKKIKSVISLGCTALELAYLASGAIDIYIETKRRKVFDFAAGMYMVDCVGGVVTDRNGRSILNDVIDMTYKSSLLIAANPELHKKLFFRSVESCQFSASKG